MPSSTWAHIPNVIEAIFKLQPTSILDVGIGYGKWGFLCREYLESWKDRVFPNQWKVRIDGIEIFVPYYERLPWVRNIYDEVHIGDACSVVDGLCLRYDVVMAGDVLEHIEKSAAAELMQRLMTIANKTLILGLPIGDTWMRNQIVADNQAESHRSSWGIDEVHQTVNPDGEFKAKVRQFDVLGRPYAVFMFSK